VKQLQYGYSLRLATKEDDPLKLYRLMASAAEHTNYAKEYIDDHLGSEYVSHFLDQSTDAFMMLLLISPEGEPVGALAAQKMYHPPFMYPMASEVVWWVEPKHRKGSVPMQMLKAYEYWAEKQGCRYVSVGFMRRFKPGKEDQMKKVYNKMGYSLQEETYVKEIG
jgi:GNAT superfamily N-acetyltransferase